MEVVISALAYGVLPTQRPLADAAKEADVKLFVPSEYGMPTEAGKEGHLATKSEFAGEWVEISVPRVINDRFISQTTFPKLSGFLYCASMYVLGSLCSSGRIGKLTCT